MGGETKMGEAIYNSLKGNFMVVKIDIFKNIIAHEQKIKIFKSDAGQDYHRIAVNLSPRGEKFTIEDYRQALI